MPIMASIFNKIRKSRKQFNKKNLNILLNHVYYNQYIDKILIGVKDLSELKEIFNIKLDFKLHKIRFNKEEIEFAQDPRKWS